QLAPVIAATLDDGADLGIAELDQRSLVDLQIGASGLVQRRELAAIDRDQVAPELIERRIGLAQDGVAAAEEMQDDRRRHRDLGRARGDGFQKGEMLRENGTGPFDRLVDDELLDRDGLAALVAMEEIALFGREATAAQRLAEE